VRHSLGTPPKKQRKYFQGTGKELLKHRECEGSLSPVFKLFRSISLNASREGVKYDMRLKVM
jgi:hypothetical protein